MAIEIRLPTLFRPQAGGAASVTVDAQTVGEAFAALKSLHPALAAQLTDEFGALHKFINVYVNDDDIRYLNQLDTKVDDGTVISILPAVAGGR